MSYKMDELKKLAQEYRALCLDRIDAIQEDYLATDGDPGKIIENCPGIDKHQEAIAGIDMVLMIPEEDPDPIEELSQIVISPELAKKAVAIIRKYREIGDLLEAVIQLGTTEGK